VSAVLAAQLAIDMFSLLGELQSRDVHHNDLHSGNLVVERLAEHRQRAEAEDPSVRLVAIDLNSAADHSMSDLQKQRYGDVHWVVSHLRELVDRLMRNPTETDDIDYRLAGLLEERAQLLSPGATSQRTPSCDECIQDIRSSELLKQSYPEYQRKRATGQRGRLRQYAKVYVRVTTGDTEGQFERLRKLIDAGVFVLDGGTHRSKTRDSDPIQQFKLTYRKLYGLSSFIGLSERDRYELSGKDLEEWLSDPSQCREILLRNLGAAEASDEIAEEDEVCVAEEGNEDLSTEPARARLLWEELEPDAAAVARAHVEDDLFASVASRGFHERKPCWSILEPASLEGRDIDVLVVGLGFEARTAVSVTRIVRRVCPHRSVCVRYKEEGRSRQIRETVGKRGIQEVDYMDVVRNGLELPKGLALVDVTGLAKPAIWHAITGALQSHRRVIVCHTEARSYYPLDADLAPVLDAEVGREYLTLLDKLGQLLTGEQGPYELHALMTSHADDTRRRFLFAFASPKHERLLAMLDHRDFDKIQVVTQRSDTPRGRLAQLAADFVVKNVPGAEALRLDSNDLGGILDAITSSYHKWYVDAGLNFECGLTGSKLQAVGCAAAAAAFKFSQAWYVQPQRFDPDRFTKGVGATQYYEVWLR